MAQAKRYLITEVSQEFGFHKDFIVHCIRSQWISPAKKLEVELDEEDIARMQLIHDLQQEFGVNDESVPIILHLLDQIHNLRGQIWKWGEVSTRQVG